MLRTLLERRYRRLGSRYLERSVFLQQQLVYVMLVGAIAYLSLYVDMSLGEFLRLSLVGCAFQFIYSLLTLVVVRRVSRPVTEWLQGARSPDATIAAWHTAAALPWELLRGGLLARPLGPALWSFFLIWCFYLAWELDLPVYSALLVYVGVVIVASYGAAVRFFGVERIVRPVLEDIESELGDRAPSPPRGLSLRARLLAALPAINVITAVVAYGLVRGGSAELGELAVVVLIATAVAATVSLILTLLLSKSITEPILELREAAGRVGAGDFDVRVRASGTDETGDLARSFNEMAAGLAERERIREAFGTYVDREVAEHILREGTSLAGEEVEVTMMFIDVRDFSPGSPSVRRRRRSWPP